MLLFLFNHYYRGNVNERTEVVYSKRWYYLRTQSTYNGKESEKQYFVLCGGPELLQKQFQSKESVAMKRHICEFCGKENEETFFWIPACCIEGYFQMPFESLTEEDIKEAKFFIGDMTNE
jgi:hypothetical protein